MNVLDLFSGIGGFSLGLERAGMRTVAFCEIEPYARAVLRKHWPHVPCYDDVRTLTADRLRSDGIVPDVICGGFPCQDISLAGEGAGIEGTRSGLWQEYARLIQEIMPRWVIVENVSALRGRGLGGILRQVAALGYDAEWHCIPASAIGAHHQRDRVWIIAHAARRRGWRIEPGWGSIRRDSDATGVGESREAHPVEVEGLLREPSITHDAGALWRIEPCVGRVADGVPNRVDRLKCLGNSVVPQIPQIIGEAIMAHCNPTF